MKNKIRLLSFLSIISVVSLCSCSTHKIEYGNVPSEKYEDRITADEHKIADFEDGFPQNFGYRNDNGNFHPFNCAFLKENVEIKEGNMDFILSKSETRYVGAEIFSYRTYGYGYYSVSMKAAKCPGVISSFFTYIGHPWHEIDIEFLGNDTTIVQFNHYTDGVGNHEYFYKLGFDAALDYHEYGFLWQENLLVYYVDGKAVYETTHEIPSVQSRIRMNLWNVADTHQEWAGKFDDTKLPVYSSYQWIGYQSV